MKRSLSAGIIILSLMLGCAREKKEIVIYCAENPNDPLCAPPENPCQLYPELYFYCVNLTPEVLCEKYPNWEICQTLTPEKVCQEHPDWSICQPQPPDYPPVITLTVSKTCGIGGDIVTLDASQSNDPEGDPLSFQWELVSGAGRFSTPTTGATVEFELPQQEVDILIKLTLSDNMGGSTEETVELHSMGTGVFVSSAGDDANPGTYAQPVSTIERALEIAYSSGLLEIKILEGEYRGGIEFQGGGITLKGGYYDRGDGCWLRDYDNHYTIIKSFISSSPSYVFKMTSQVTSLITLDGLYLVGATSEVSPSLEVYSIYISGGYGMAVKNSYIYGGEGPRVRGIYVDSATQFSLIHSRVDGGRSTTVGPLPNRGGVVITNTYSVGITGSIIYGGISTGSSTSIPRYIVGLHIGNATHCALHNSLIYGGTGYNSYDSGVGGSPDFVTIGLSTDSPCEVYHNFIYGGDPVESASATTRSGLSYGIYLVSGASTGIKIVNNIIDPGSAGAVALNTSGRYGVYDFDGIAPNYVFKNNDIYCTIPYMPNEVPTLYYDGGISYTNISSLNAIDGNGGNFDGNLSVDPVLDPDGIHLSPTSPLIDAGYPGDAQILLPSTDIDGDTRPYGSGYDIGPDEVR